MPKENKKPPAKKAPESERRSSRSGTLKLRAQVETTLAPRTTKAAKKRTSLQEQNTTEVRTIRIELFVCVTI